MRRPSLPRSRKPTRPERRSRGPKPLRELEARARAAAARGDVAVAIDLFSRLEVEEADDPEWPRHLASLYGRSGRVDQELDALVRCADRHAARKEFIPALATYKMVLSTDPGHVAAQQRLSDLQPQSDSISVHYLEEEQARISRRPAPQQTATSAPLDELVLTEIVEGARPAGLGDDPLDGIHEIPLEIPLDETLGEDSGEEFGEDLEFDDCIDEPPRSRPAPVTRRAAAPGSERASAQQESLAHLERIPLFSSLDRQSLGRLVEHVELVRLAPGEELFHQGDPAGALYVVAKGAVVPIAEGEPRTRLAVLEAGEFFGEIALFTNQPRNATIEALVDTQLLCIDRAVMWRLVQEHAQVLSVLLQFLRERLIQRLVRTSPLFQIFSSSKRSAIARRFRFLEVSDGNAVIEQHHPAEAVFILLSGSMDVVHREGEPGQPSVEGSEKVLATLAPGELFGEMSLLWREPSLATVVARGKCWLLALPAESFREMLDHHPELAEMASRIARERREQNKRTLRDALGHRDGEAGLI